MKPKLSDLWRWEGDLARGTFLFWGILLAAIKFNLDRLIAYAWFGQEWTLFGWETWRFYLWQSPMEKGEQPYFLAILVASLPFLLVGTLLTLRRLRSIGWKPTWILLFFVPMVKLIFFAVLCILPSRNEAVLCDKCQGRWLDCLSAILPHGKWSSAFVAVVITSAITVLSAWGGIAIFRDYGWTIFVGLPFFMGFLSALLDSFHETRSLRRCLAVANCAVLLVGLGLILFALEGVICLIMAAPLAFVVASIGGALGYVVQKSFYWRAESAKLFCSVILLLPLAMGLEHAASPVLPLLEVRSSVVVNAPPEKVWQNVVSFAELPPPKEMIFKLGIAYPIRAEIDGCGVGAVRHCNFSTGPFVEPIEVWDEPRLLKFSVTEDPEPMQEWTPYREVHPAHLDGYLESRAGQFRLIPLAQGRTLLEGTTWYYHRLWPAAYWQVWSDHIIHTIHNRVLNHVKELSEKPT
jgi:uncharacterized membrane protein YhaH (DUF805 family)